MPHFDPLGWRGRMHLRSLMSSTEHHAPGTGTAVRASWSDPTAQSSPFSPTGSPRAADAASPESALERDYCLAWFLAVLEELELRAVPAFKGGTALKRCYFPDYRFSEDLDFTLTAPVTTDELKGRLEAVYAAVREASGIVFAFDREDRQKRENSYTFYLKYEGPLPRGSDVKVDITMREKLVHPLLERPVLRGYEEFTDLPENRLLLVYSLKEIATEKTLALADRARNEPRDLYDLWHLTSKTGIELGALAEGMRRKLEFRGKQSEGLADAIRSQGVPAESAMGKAAWVPDGSAAGVR